MGSVLHRLRSCAPAGRLRGSGGGAGRDRGGRPAPRRDPGPGAFRGRRADPSPSGRRADRRLGEPLPRRRTGRGRTMVIGERFAWAHMPKTAGTATVAMLHACDGLVRFADSPEGADAHSTFADRRELVDGKLLVLNLRRLPSWVLSRAHYVSLHGVYPDFEPIPF